MYTKGQAIEVEVATGWDQEKCQSTSDWFPGVFVGYGPGDFDEDFERISVTLNDGRSYRGCHPNCVRPVDVE